MTDATQQAAVGVRVRGRVQGVSFRHYTEMEAKRLGVVGWVRNEADGSVSGEFYGTPQAVAALVEWCHSGPPRARVERVETVSLPTPAQLPAAFGVKF
ncbi:MAG: acylphosphatase [Magnetococcales bacterium]|nr:acylphosphatase [Magnetococcales bacterium]